MSTKAERKIVGMYTQYFTAWETADPSLDDKGIDALAGFSMARGGEYDRTIQTSGVSEPRVKRLEQIGNRLVKREVKRREQNV